MTSNSLKLWNEQRALQLDEIESAHEQVGGTGRGRRFATQQINHAYAALLSSQFQGFCRDLHSEAVDHLVRSVQPASLQEVLRAEFLLHRKLDQGNPNAGNIGADFNRLGLKFWDMIQAESKLNSDRAAHIEDLNNWRNAIAHQDFDPRKVSGTINLERVRRWRKACSQLANAFDRVIRRHVTDITGVAPW